MMKLIFYVFIIKYSSCYRELVKVANLHMWIICTISGGRKLSFSISFSLGIKRAGEKQVIKYMQCTVCDSLWLLHIKKRLIRAAI